MFFLFSLKIIAFSTVSFFSSKLREIKHFDVFLMQSMRSWTCCPHASHLPSFISYHSVSWTAIQLAAATLAIANSNRPDKTHKRRTYSCWQCAEMVRFG